MSELCGVIQKRLNYAPLTQNNEQRMKNITRLKQVFKFLTVDGLTEYLNSFVDGDITDAMKKFMKE